MQNIHEGKRYQVFDFCVRVVYDPGSDSNSHSCNQDAGPHGGGKRIKHVQKLAPNRGEYGHKGQEGVVWCA